MKPLGPDFLMTYRQVLRNHNYKKPKFGMNYWRTECFNQSSLYG